MLCWILIVGGLLIMGQHDRSKRCSTTSAWKISVKIATSAVVGKFRHHILVEQRAMAMQTGYDWQSRRESATDPIPLDGVMFERLKTRIEYPTHPSGD